MMGCCVACRAFFRLNCYNRHVRQSLVRLFATYICSALLHSIQDWPPNVLLGSVLAGMARLRRKFG